VGRGDKATAVGHYSAIVTALYRRESTGKGAYGTHVMREEGVWFSKRFDPGALCEAHFFDLHDRKSRPMRRGCVSRIRWQWFVLVVTSERAAVG